MKLLCILLAGFFCDNVISFEVATHPNRQTWVTDGFVQAIREFDGTIYVAGNFKHAGPWSGSAALVDPATGEADTTFPKIDGVIGNAIADGAGGLFLIGSFTDIGGISRTNIAHFTADGRFDSNWVSRATNSIRGLAVNADTIFFWGPTFSEFNVTYTPVRAMRLADGELLPFAMNVRGTVNAMIATTNRLYIGGAFNHNNTSLPYNLAAYDLNGQLQNWDPKVNGEVKLMVADERYLYIAGSFSGVGSRGVFGLASIDLTNASSPAWNPLSGSSSVSAMRLSAGTLFVAGYLAVGGGPSNTNLAAFSVIDGALIPFVPQSVAFNPQALAATDDYVLTGGNPSTLGPGYDSRVDRLLTIVRRDTGESLPTSLTPNFAVITTAPLAGKILVGGAFSALRGEERMSAAAFNAQTGELTTWNPQAQSNIYALAVTSDKVFLGGEFSFVAGQPRKNLAAVDRATGDLDFNWRADADLGVIDMAIYQNTLYAGGVFRNVAGQSHTNIVAIDIPTSSVLPWNPMLNSGFVRALTVVGDTLYFGGSFRTVFGVTRNRAAAIDLTTGQVTSWDPQLPSSGSLVEDIEVAGNTIYLCGRFNSVAGQPRTNAAAVTLTGELLPWAPNPDGSVVDIAVAGDKVFLTGNFFNVDKQPRTALAMVNNTDGHVLPWSPNPEFFGYCVTATRGQLYFGGACYTLFSETHFGLGSFALSARPPPFQNPNVIFGSNGVRLEFESTPGIEIIPQYSEDFRDWFDLPSVTVSAGVNVILDQNSGIRPRSFYRLKQLDLP